MGKIQIKRKNDSKSVELYYCHNAIKPIVNIIPRGHGGEGPNPRGKNLEKVKEKGGGLFGRTCALPPNPIFFHLSKLTL